MIYKMKIADSVDEMVFDLLEVPIEDKDIEGTADNTTIDGNVFTDYLWLKKQFTQKWSLMCKDDYTQLRGFYTRQWENAEVPTYKLYVGNDIRETKSATGNSFQITNSTEYDAPITDFKLDGNTEQTGTPTPDSPQPINTTTGENVVKIMGKNLWQDGDRSFTTYYQKYNLNIPAGTYTFSAIVTSSDTSSQYSRAYFYAGNTSIGYVSLTRGARSSGTITLNSTADRIVLYASIDYGTSNGKTATYKDIQLELGSQATTYEAYRGTDYEVNLGKNLLNIPDGTYSNNGITATVSGGEITLTGTATATSFINITIPSITLSKPWSFSLNNTAYGDNDTAMRLYKSDGVNYTGVVSKNANAKTENQTAYGVYDRVQIRTSSGVIAGGATAKLQLEYGSTATTFAPYFTPIELCKIGTYQDYIWNDNGTWKVHKAVGKTITDGTYYNSRYGTNNYGLTAFLVALNYDDYYNTEIITNMISDYFTKQTTSFADTQTEGFLPTLNTSTHRLGVWIRIKTSTADTEAEMKTWLNNNKPVFYYVLDTATDTAITESALITQLDDIKNATLPQGAVNIMLTPSAGEMEISYELIHEKETIIRDTTPVRLTLTDGGVINPCECRQNVQITMRETTQ